MDSLGGQGFRAYAAEWLVGLEVKKVPLEKRQILSARMHRPNVVITTDREPILRRRITGP